jgi:hypothetical protein
MGKTKKLKINLKRNYLKEDKHALNKPQMDKVAGPKLASG